MSIKAIVHAKYGPPEVLQLRDIEKPKPKDDEVLVEVHAASLNSGDLSDLKGRPLFIRLFYGLFSPKNTKLGYDFAGRIERVGRNVQRFQPGDEIFGDVSGYGWGAFAEYICAPESAIAIKPQGTSFEEAAAIPVAAQVALQGLRDRGRIQHYQKILINGASGGVGTFAVQIVKSFDAEVTAVCSTKNVDLMYALGADHVIDYSKDDFTENGLRYDLILAANGYHSISAYRKSLNPHGIYVATGGSGAQFIQAMILGPIISAMGSRKISAMLIRPNKKDLIFLKELLEKGTIKSIIDRRYSLSELPEALHYLAEGHAHGKVILTIKQAGSPKKTKIK